MKLRFPQKPPAHPGLVIHNQTDLATNGSSARRRPASALVSINRLRNVWFQENPALLRAIIKPIHGRLRHLFSVRSCSVEHDLFQILVAGNRHDLMRCAASFC